MKLKPTLYIILLLITSFSNAQRFIDEPSNEPTGDFPKRWDLIKGSAEIATFEQQSVISFTNNSIIKPIIKPDNYLTDNFTIEFDAHFDEVEKVVDYQFYNIRFWDGSGNSKENIGTGTMTIYPLKIVRYGASQAIKEPSNSKQIHKNHITGLKGLDPTWRQIKISFNKGAYKVFINDMQILSMPRVKFTPKMVSIESIYQQSSRQFMQAIKNVKIYWVEPQETENDQNTEDDETLNEQTTNTNYNLPANDGAPGQILQTDGNGNVTWVYMPLTEVASHTHETTSEENTNQEITNNESNNSNYRIQILAGGEKGYKDSTNSITTGEGISQDTNNISIEIDNTIDINSTTNIINSSAKFNAPRDLAIDKTGNVYVTDANNYKIRKITPYGFVTTIAGTTKGFADGSKDIAKFNSLNHIVISSTGDIYVTDKDENQNHFIRKISPSSEITTVSQINSDLGYFRDLAIDSEDNIFATFKNSNAIHRIYFNEEFSLNNIIISFSSSLAGNISEEGFSDGPLYKARFDNPTSIAFDLNNNMYVVDRSRSIRKISNSGIVSTLIGWGFEKNFAVSLAVSSSNNFYITLDWGYKVYNVKTNGQFIECVNHENDLSNIGGTTSGHLPGLTTDKLGNLYIADWQGNKIFKVSK